MFSFCIIFFYLFNSCYSSNKLIFAMIHFRHGARASTFSGNVDSMGEYWENSGQLTGVGERMHYLLGLRNRKRYIKNAKLLSEKYKLKELRVISTGVNRTILSALSHLQGLYPQTENIREILNEFQLNMSYPPLSLNNSEIEEELNQLNNSSLPNNMTLIPFEIINSTSFLLSFAQTGCQGALNYSSRSNTEGCYLIESEFNKKFSLQMNKFLNKENYNYSFTAIARMCDTFIADYTDGRNMTRLKEAGVNFLDLYNLCLKTIGIYYSEYIIRTDEIFFLEGTEIMELLINYVKKSINDDINGKNIEPKMLIYSGHDITISKQEFFLIKAFGLNMSSYQFPTYGSQLSFEIERNNNNNNRNYSDYIISYYFNDELLLKMTVDKFFNKIEPNIWSQEKINNFCSYNISEEIIEFKSEKKDKNNYKIALIIITCLFGISLIANIITLICLFKLKKNHHLNISSSMMEIKKFNN